MDAATAFAVLWLASGAATADQASATNPAETLQQICAAAQKSHDSNDWPKALPAALECEKAARAQKDDALLARGLYIHAAVLYRQGSPVDSSKVLQEAVTVSQRAGNSTYLSESYRLLASNYSDMGDWPRYVDYSKRAYDAKPVKTDRDRVFLIETRAWAGMELRDREASLKNFDEATAMVRAMKDPNLVAWLLSERGLAYWRLSRDEPRATADLHESLAIARSIGSKSRMRNVLNTLGNIMKKPGTWYDAERYYKEGVELARQEKAVDPFLLKNLGIVYRETNRRAEAEKILLEALQQADRYNFARIRWQARMELGTFYRLSDPEKAARYFEECLNQLEGTHSNVLLENFAAGAIAGSITINDDPYDLYIDLLNRRKDFARGFGIAERARARAFLDTLSGAREVIAGAIRADYITNERALLESISSNQARLRKGDVRADARDGLEKSIAGDEEKLEALRVRFALDHPEIAHSRFPKLIDAQTVQQTLLAPDEALIEYFVGAEATTLWVIRRDAQLSFQLEPRAKLDQAVREYVAATASPTGEYETAGRNLAERLLPGGTALIGNARRLIVVPHGILNYLPFETLLLPDGRFLTEAYAISYAPSAATLSFLRSLPTRTAGTVVAIGDPVLQASGASTERSVRFSQLSLLKPLKFTSRELDSVSSAFPGTRRLEKQKASEAELRNAGLSEASIVHFATHGLIDEELPQRSGLVLSAAAGDDGILQMREVYNLGLKGALVTLSACNTALGKDVTGEGIIGLTRAFIHAGALAVFGSLWNVDDASTSEFMGRFYKSLSEGKATDEAAQAARLAFLKGDARLRHPYYWGAFIITGRASAPVAVTVQSSPGLSGLLILAAAVAIGLVVWLARRVR